MKNEKIDERLYVREKQYLEDNFFCGSPEELIKKIKDKQKELKWEHLYFEVFVDYDCTTSTLEGFRKRTEEELAKYDELIKKQKEKKKKEDKNKKIKLQEKINKMQKELEKLY